MNYIKAGLVMWFSFILQLSISKYINTFLIPINLVFITVFIIGVKTNFKIGLFSGLLGGFLMDISLMNNYGVNTIIGLWIGGICGFIGETV